MRRSTLILLTVSLIIVGIASWAVAQHPGTIDRSSGSPTLLDLLQSRLKTGGLSPVIPPADKPSPPSSRYVTGSDPRPGPKRVTISGSTVPQNTYYNVPGSAPLPTKSQEKPHDAPSATRQMHQRLSAFRNSQFGRPNPSTNSDTSEAEAESTPEIADDDDIPQTPAGEFVQAPEDPDDEPRIVGEALPGANLPQPRLAAPSPKYAVESPKYAVESPKYAVDSPKFATESSPQEPAARGDTPAPTPSKPATVNDRAPELSSRVLVTQQSPILTVKTVGPERIDVGREATFRVIIENLGSAPADQLLITIDFPQWADLLGAEVSTGATSSEVAVDGTRLFNWKIGQLGANDIQTVALHIVARESQPLNLAVNWQHAPVAAAASIRVLQPELKLSLDGPEEVLFGKKQLYRLELENAGTGNARAVALSLLPLGTGQDKPAVQAIGNLEAGQKKTIELELTARNEGDLVIQVEATAEGNYRTDLSERVRVLRPALAVDVAAPEFQFVGQELTYQIVVANPGTARARDVNIRAELPETVTYVSSTKDGLVSEVDGRLRWMLEELEPQQSRTLLVKCMARAAGKGRIAVTSKAADNLDASGEASVQIDAIADLALEVTDPTGPVPVGTETVYQLKIENRGSKAADNVEMVAYFSHGIEPLSAEGGNYQIGPGQVVFDAIPSIAAGQAKTFVVKARADTSGNHIIRAEVFCKPLGTRLVGEESTYFYGKRGSAPTDVAPPHQTAAGEGVFTADQRGAAPTETSEQPKE